jgi:hypothetical protein
VAAIRVGPLPPGALLGKYARLGAYTDCYSTEVPGIVSLGQYVEAFYTGRVFKVERLLLGLFLARPSTDAEARQLASGELGSFSAWHVEDRTADQLLMCPVGAQTRSWFMVTPGPGPSTRLCFGSAVLPASSQKSGPPRMGPVFRALLGFHKVYSRVLLGAARDRLVSAGSAS